MKKTISLLLAAMLALFAASAIAAQPTRGARYQDANNDGVCDVCGAADADGDGICDGLARPEDGTGRRAGRGCRGFVDANGDGVCDNRANGGARRGWRNSAK